MNRTSQRDGGSASPVKLEARVLAAVEQGDMKQAIVTCKQLNQQFPEFASGWYTASQLAAKIGNANSALHAIENALKLQPESPRWMLQKAGCLMRMGNTQAARPLVEQLDTLDLGSAFQCSQLALQLSRLERHERALYHYQRAISLEPKQAEHYYNLATVHRFLGDFSAAEQALERAIQLNPGDFEAYKLRSDLGTQTQDSNHIESLHSVLANYRSDKNAQVQLNFTLAKEYEDLGDWSRSFHHLSEGASARRTRMRYDVQGDIDTMSAISTNYGTDFIDGHSAGHANTEAIFILGMPRTGTTLVERILGSHSAVVSAGELNNFALEMSRETKKLIAPGKAQAGISKRERVVASTGLNFSQLGQQYISSTRPLTGTTERFIDKMPLNFLYAGLIHLSLPQAKIIHLQRHPLDTCFAIYKTLFADAYPFSYQLEELGRYYAAYRRLMAHWQKVMPGVIFDQSYEALVNNVSEEAQRLLEYCELPWESTCLEFHSQLQASTTASATQVRQPVYTSSVGKWRRFENELAPLIRVLESEGIDPQLD